MAWKNPEDQAAYAKAWREKNAERVREHKRAYAATFNARRRERWAADREYRERMRAQALASHVRYREERNAKKRANYHANSAAINESRREYFARYRAENREVCRERCRPHYRKNKAKRKAALAHRTPAWADHDAIAFFYECAPAGCHVDHIVPLRGKRVSGLHVETNLQWLPDVANLRKGATFEPRVH